MTRIEDDEAVPMQLQPLGSPPGRFVWVGLVVFVVVAIALAIFVDDRPSVVDPAILLAPSNDVEAPRSVVASVSPEAGPIIQAYRKEAISITWPGIDIRLVKPATWWTSASGTAICAPSGRIDCTVAARPNLAVHAVAGVVIDPCDVAPWGPDRNPTPDFEPVGLRVDDMASVLQTMVGPRGPGPAAVDVGGFPARRYVLQGIVDHCGGGPDGRNLWVDADGSFVGLLKGGTEIVYLVDVAGERLVITTHHRGASAEEVAQLDAIVGSIEIEPNAALRPDPGGDGEVYRAALTTGSIPFTVAVDASWESKGRVSVNKSFHGPQGAEAIVFWTGFPDDAITIPCAILRTVEPSMAGLAEAVATAPGTELISGPSDVIVGGTAATHVTVVVRDDRGCEPGYFFSWPHGEGGAMWDWAEAGDMIEVWIVDVDGALLFVGAETHRDPVDGTDMTQADWAQVDREIHEIVDSIRFD